MEACVFLFPQFNFLAPKEEAYFKMLGPEDLKAPRMKDSNSRLKDKRSRLSLLLTKSGSHENIGPEKKTTTATSKTEFSEENIEFWLACEEYKTINSDSRLITKAKQMYAVFIEAEAPKEVNIDYATKVAIRKNIATPTNTCFDAAQSKVYSLMKKDCYPRFLTSDIYLRLTKRKGPGTTMYRRRSRSCVFNEPRGEATGDSSAWLQRSHGNKV
ncbi:unnamed protein product [Coregonus sp. 'balchen']|nr:unnamed protein product [Coregonus sp. 'balchen']